MTTSEMVDALRLLRSFGTQVNIDQRVYKALVDGIDRVLMLYTRAQNRDDEGRERAEKTLRLFYVQHFLKDWRYLKDEKRDEYYLADKEGKRVKWTTARGTKERVRDSDRDTMDLPINDI